MSQSRFFVFALLAVVFAGIWLTAPRRSPPDRGAVLQILAVDSPAGQSPRVRVGLLADAVRSLSISISGPFVVRPVGDERVLHRAERLEFCEISATPIGLRVGRQEFPITRLEIMPRNSPGAWVENHQYRGAIRVYRQPGGTVIAVNVLPLEEYVASVVDSEMPAEFSAEARAAQAIVARTYALYQMRAVAGTGLVDLHASTRSQKYLGFQYKTADGRRLAGETEDSRRLTAETAGLVCLSRGDLFCTYYSATCGGTTLQGTEMFADAAAPLQSVPCTWCEAAPLYRWSLQIARADLQADLARFFKGRGATLGKLQTVHEETPIVAGRLPQFDIRGNRGTAHASGAELRRAMTDRGVHSPRFHLSDQGPTFMISGQGHGHGVGLCQWGARGLARAGRNRFQILAYYYPGATIARVVYP